MSRLNLLVVVGVLGAITAGCNETYDYDRATAGEDETGREPHAKTSSQFLRAIYADLVGRAPAAYEFVISFDGTEAFRVPIDEERELTTTLDGIGDSLPMRNLIVQGLLHSSEITLPTRSSAGDPRAYITTQFERLLGRTPNAYELDAFAAEWDKEAAVGPRTIIRAIIGSREYQSQ